MTTTSSLSKVLLRTIAPLVRRTFRIICQRLLQLTGRFRLRGPATTEIVKAMRLTRPPKGGDGRCSTSDLDLPSGEDGATRILHHSVKVCGVLLFDTTLIPPNL